MCRYANVRMRKNMLMFKKSVYLFMSILKKINSSIFNYFFICTSKIRTFAHQICTSKIRTFAH
jgi:hypothetical protein